MQPERCAEPGGFTNILPCLRQTLRKPCLFGLHLRAVGCGFELPCVCVTGVTVRVCVRECGQ